MKYFTTLAVVATFAGAGLAACSSTPESDPGKGSAGHTSAAGTTSTLPTAGTSSGGSVGMTTGGTLGSAGTAVTAGTSSGGVSSGGTASGRAGGTSSGGTSSGGAGGSSDNPNAVVTTCAPQKYTPTATPGAACATMAVPAAKLIAAFEAAGPAAGWGVYPNVDAMTGFMPTTPTPSAGGANGTSMALNYTVTNLAQGIKLQVGFGMQCQDVRTFQGLSFWAKGTIDAATMPFAVDANTLVIQVGSEKSLLGGCMGAECAPAPPDKRITIAADWKEYRIPFDCLGDGKVFDGYFTNILFSAFGTNSAFSLDQVGYY